MGERSLFDAARQWGLRFSEEATPVDADVMVDGLRLHYLDWGKPGLPPMILLHGGAQTAHSWGFFALTMRDHFRVVAKDLRGHGDSGWAPDGDYSLEAHYRDQRGFMEALGYGEPVILVGLSRGGRIAYTYAARHPGKVAALILVDTGPDSPFSATRSIQDFMALPDTLDDVEDFVERAARFNPHRQREELRRSLLHNLKQLPGREWTWKYDPRLRSHPWTREELEHMDKEGWECLPRIECPTFIMRGAESPILDQSVAERMASVMPSASVATIDKAGHTVNGDNPPAFEREAKRFLREAGLLS